MEEVVSLQEIALVLKKKECYSYFQGKQVLMNCHN